MNLVELLLLYMYCFLLLYSIFIFGIVDVTLSGFERLEVPVLFC